MVKPEYFISRFWLGTFLPPIWDGRPATSYTAVIKLNQMAAAWHQQRYGMESKLSLTN